MVRLKSDEMRYLSTSLWTPQLDKQLRKLAAKGLSARQIGEQLNVGRNAVIGRWARLRGLVFRCEVEREKKLRTEAAVRRRERKRRSDAAVAALRRGLARGVRSPKRARPAPPTGRSARQWACRASGCIKS